MGSRESIEAKLLEASVREGGGTVQHSDASSPQDESFKALLMERDAAPRRESMPGVVIGTLVALDENGCVPMVVFEGQTGTAALRARTTLDLHGAHVGREVALVFQNGDIQRPIVMGVMNDAEKPLTQGLLSPVDVQADGQRMVVNAREQIVLKCGKASITLTKAGKVLIEGEYVLSRSTGVNRIKGGSVQLN